MSFLQRLENWLSAIQDDVLINLVAGLLASAIVLVSQTLVRSTSLVIAALFTVKYQLSQLWGFRKPQRVFVVSGAIGLHVPPEVQTAIIAGPDADAASIIIATLGLLYPNAEIHHVYSSSFPREQYKENLVVVGGPVNNQCSKEMLEYVAQWFSYDSEFHMVLGEILFETCYGETETAVRDYGAVIRVANPYNDTKDVIIVSGCDTHGVLAAATLLSSRKDGAAARKEVKRKLGIGLRSRPLDYIAVVECAVLGNDIGHIKEKEVQILNAEWSPNR